jgi:hypothetical protein
MTPICPDCGSEFDNIGTHWRHNGYPEIDQHTDSLIGMALGDGSFDRGSGESRLGFIMTNKTFLDWYRNQLDWLATDVRVHRTPEQLVDAGWGESDPEAYSTQYVLRTRNHPTITEWHGWMMTPEKHIPNGLELTWDILRYWYVCDGHKEFSENAANPRITIGASNFAHQEDTIVKKFDSLGLDARVYSNVIRLPVKDTQRFLDQTEPLPGFTHKWSDTQAP